MGAIFKREMRAYFTSPIAYIFLAVFYVYTGSYFIRSCIDIGSSDMTYVFSGIFTLIMIMLPLLTMRLMSEEKKQKTEQCLLTAPVSLMEIVMGKFLAAVAVFMLGMLIYIPYVLVLYKLAGHIAWATVIGNFCALSLLGASFISIGIFISCLTENQIVAAIASFIVIIFLYMVDVFAGNVDIAWLKSVMVAIGFYNRFYEFTNGIINITSIVFFLSTIFMFNFLTVRVLEKRRWG